MGLLPGTGTIGWSHAEEFIPLLRPAAADLNFTLAIAVFSVLLVQFVGIRATGLVNYFSKFVNIRGIILAIPKGPMAVIIAMIEFGVGLIEIVSELAKVLSLSLRLFGNVFAGEILIGVMLSLFAFVLPVPFMFLEVLVGAIQATVFSILVLAFLTVATDAHGHETETEPVH
jgi:F-type H+-transporting ATPase subunit a